MEGVLSMGIVWMVYGYKMQGKAKPGNDESRAKPGYDESRAKPGFDKSMAKPGFDKSMAKPNNAPMLNDN